MKTVSYFSVFPLWECETFSFKKQKRTNTTCLKVHVEQNKNLTDIALYR